MYNDAAMDSVFETGVVVSEHILHVIFSSANTKTG